MVRGAKEAKSRPPADDDDLEADYQAAELLVAMGWRATWTDLAVVPQRVVELLLEIRRGQSDAQQAENDKHATPGPRVTGFGPEDLEVKA